MTDEELNQRILEDIRALADEREQYLLEHVEMDESKINWNRIHRKIKWGVFKISLEEKIKRFFRKNV